MPEVETFDAFYARTVWNVTSQMHALAEGDGAADHAIREAYARAYQQWYEISTHPDTERWVLNAAKDAYQRRRPDAPIGSRPGGPADGSQGGARGDGAQSGGSWDRDSQDDHRSDSTWPGIYRPRAGAVPPADPEATLAPPVVAASRGRSARPSRFFFGDRGRGTQQAQEPAGPGQEPQAAQPAGAQTRGPQTQGAQVPGIQVPGTQPPSAPVPGAGAPDAAVPDAAAGGAGQSLGGGQSYGDPLSGGQSYRDPLSGGQSYGAPQYGGQAGQSYAGQQQFDAHQPYGAQQPYAAPGYAGAQPYGGQTQNFVPSGSQPTAGWTADGRPGGGVRPSGKPWLADRRKVVAGVAALAILVAGLGYLLLGNKPASPGAANTATGHGKPAVQMLTAGHTGRRSQVPWNLVGAGWVVAELSAAQPGSSGSYSIALVDPQGGKYKIGAWTGGSNPALLAVSGNHEHALFSSAGGYSLLDLQTGQLSSLSLPAGVTAIGFTNPDGLNVLAVQQSPAKFKLERYSLTGAHTGTLASLSRRNVQGGQPETCAFGCEALSSPDGTEAVWGVSGDEMQLVGNNGGLIRKLPVPDSGHPPSCTPISWWDASTVLAECAATGGQLSSERLWLVPLNGTPSPLTPPFGSGSGAGELTGAWQADGQVYVTATNFTQCQGAATGPGGLQIARLDRSSGSTSPVKVGGGSTNNHNSVVTSVGSQLLVLAQTSCPGTSSLLLLNPSNGSTQALLPESSNSVGVVAAVALAPLPSSSSA